MLKKHLSYSNVAASFALFVALGGTAVAAATLERDSVGAPQIKKDAVRSPEIQKGAVRSSEILDDSVKAVDLTEQAASDVLGEIHVAERTTPSVAPDCGREEVRGCPDILRLVLPSGADNWLVQAKLVTNGVAVGSFVIEHCGLVDTEKPGPNALLDELKYTEGLDAMALSGVVRKSAGNPAVALRCTSRPENQTTTENVKLTALEVGSVTGP